MAIGLLTVLKLVPWSDVIQNAPLVADGAKKLWGAVGKKTPVPAAAASADSVLTPELQTGAALQARLAAMEEATNELQQQMLASSELIKALAEQNTQLIQRAEVNRLRLLALAGVTAIAIITALLLGFLR